STRTPTLSAIEAGTPLRAKAISASRSFDRYSAIGALSGYKGLPPSALAGLTTARDSVTMMKGDALYITGDPLRCRACPRDLLRFITARSSVAIGWVRVATAPDRGRGCHPTTCVSVCSTW